ncbi:ribonuclease P protein component, partial [Streptococcus suis]
VIYLSGNAFLRIKINLMIRHILIEFKIVLVEDEFVMFARKGVDELSYQEMNQNLINVLKLDKL